MVVGQVPEMTDVLVIGGGPGGYAAALRAAGAGRSTVLVERAAVGGVCLNVGCIPSKALIEVAETVHRARTTPGVTTGVSIDWPAVQAHLTTVTRGLTDGVRSLLDGAGVAVVSGTARFVQPRRVLVDEGEHVRAIEATHIVVATGSSPIELPGLRTDGERVVDSTGALFLPELPGSLAVVGGGYIGIELGTAFAKLGVRVTIVEATDRLLPGLDPALGRVAGRRLRELGVEVRLGHQAMEPTAAGLLVRPAGGGEPVEVAAARIAVAVGRRPNTADLGLASAGLAAGPDGLLEVGPDRRLVGAPHVFALGDVTAGPALAHKATAEAEVVGGILRGEAAAFDPAAIPQVVYADPEIVSVGLTAAAMEEAGATASTFRFPLSASGRAATVGDRLGFAEVVADAEGTIRGVHLAGPHASELAGEAALIVELAATLEEVAGTIHAHPTIGEAIMEAAHGALGRPLHVRAAARRHRR